MRRISSLFLSLGLVAAGVAFVATSASAAPGDITTSTATAVAPAAISGATPARIVRLPQANAFLAVGRVVATSGAHNFIWKINADLTIDATFGAVDLGNEFAFPTSSESTCTGYFCHSIGSFVVDERLGKYAISFSRSVKGTSNPASNATVTSLVVGSISTGAVVAKSVFLSLTQGGSATAADYSAYATDELSKDQCTTATGATVNGAPLNLASVSSSSLQFRPDGSLFVGLYCDYSNLAQLSLSSPGTLKTASSQLFVGLKISGSTIVLDTSFGTNGRTVIADGTSACAQPPYPIQTVDGSITSASSTQPYFINALSVRPKTTTLPGSYGGYSYVTGFDGCDNGFIPGTTSFTNSLIPVTASGTRLTAISLGDGSSPTILRWIIDPAGRWNTLIRMTSGMGLNMTTTYTALRIANGVLDTTLGANGQKQITNLPSTVSVGGTTVNMTYSISGIANTATESYFIGFASASDGSGSCSSNTTVTQKSFAYQLSFDTGLITSYGTNGLGAPGTYSRVEKGFCPDGGNAASSFVDSAGRPGYLVNLAALGSQASGLVQFKWDAATGVTNGGDGSIGVEIAPAPTTTLAPTTTTTTTTTIVKITTTTVAKNRVDTKVYSKTLPVVSQQDTALQVLSAQDAMSQDIQTTTPKICTPLSTAVLLVNPGRCVIQIVDAKTKKVVRSSSTLVKNTPAIAGSVLSTSNPIDFDFASTVLTKSAKAQIAKIAKLAKGARRLAVIGHTASLTDASVWNLAISRGRAEAVKSALQSAGVKAPIEIVALANAQPLTTKKTESSQAKNRRVEVYVFPS